MSSRCILEVGDANQHLKAWCRKRDWDRERAVVFLDPYGAGCKHCYAERMAKRLQAMGAERYRTGFSVTLQRDLLDLPKQWKKPRVIFVNSMSDLFHSAVFATMKGCPQHTFQVLTKRTDRLRSLGAKLPWPRNVWMGVSIEDARVMHRVKDLASIPAQVRFLSCEPLIGPPDELHLNGIHWVIVGGESGPGARTMQHEWVESIRQRCARARIPFFFKQWGGVRKGRTGRELNGRTYDEMPGVPFDELALTPLLA